MILLILPAAVVIAVWAIVAYAKASKASKDGAE